MNFIILSIFIMIGVALELLLSFQIFLVFEDVFYFLFLFGRFFSFLIVLIIVRNSRSLNMDIPWIILILLFPFIGTLIYFICGTDVIGSNLLKRISRSIQDGKRYFKQDEEIGEEILKRNNNAFVYLSKSCGFPVTRGNKVMYYPDGEAFFEQVKKELKEARRFIFIEFFSIEIGTLWGEVLDILKERVQDGVEVRMIYDNTACMRKVPSKYYQELEKLGIRCEAYYKKKPLFGFLRNHRDHRKCIIVDGRIAFTGGMNIEDRYVNLEQPYGYWKDVGISVCGDGVWNFTVMFFCMWNALRQEEEDYTKYRSDLLDSGSNLGYVVPFGENPLALEGVGKNVYISMIYQAKETLYIFTPYLILDMDIYQAFVYAVKRGVDVRIIIPGIPDKKSVYQVSLLNAKRLSKNGVKVYTYTPGFMHGKVFFVDDKMAVVGTMNMDYRSLCFDFEYGVLMEDVEVIGDIRRDIDSVLEKSIEVGVKETNFLLALWEAILQLFAPLM